MPSPLILMSSKALNHPSNAVLSLTIHSLNNELNLSKPIFTNASATEFLAYQLQPLAYYASQLHNSAPQDKRRLYSKIAITCLKLMYLANHADKRTFIYEHELKSHPFTDIDATLVRDILDRALPDDKLLLAVTSLESLVMQYPLIAEIASFLASTNLYFSDKNTYPIEIIDAVFLENNRMKRSDALFI